MNGKGNPQVYIELQGTPNSQNNLEKEEKNGKIHTFWFQNFPWSDSKQDMVALA